MFVNVLARVCVSRRVCTLDERTKEYRSNQNLAKNDSGHSERKVTPLKVLTCLTVFKGLVCGFLTPMKKNISFVFERKIERRKII